ncbi:sensor histidine kinase [Microlunatus flavus]|uniref:Histidine kinase-like ATPase domain-containing protein n=1 Tax=Microlunatus flavus TaxID=1036181 RepID=A0A1H9J4V9_9ACTN|nr:GAF domain-containing protein [Microlunatus flavus]SEQ82081.1 Histidine kinase-like ATPase domain-containing protein [Microlunatus flavus]
MSELVDRANRIAQTQRTLELLMEANRAILAELSPEAVLRRIVVAARELVGARYAALGVLAADGSLEQFIHDGFDGQHVCAVGDLPRGEGLLGVLVADPRPLRLERMSEHPLSTGTPPGHPAMESFLGVPIEVRGEVYGNLYLTERAAGGAFTDDDETTLLALAATAGIAIENARLYETARRRERWAEAAAEVSSSLLDPGLGGEPVGLIADTVLRLTSADVVSVVVPTGHATFRVLLARGRRAPELEDLEYDAKATIAGLALSTGRGVRVARLEEQPRFTVHVQRVLDVGAALALPLHGSLGSHGVLVVARERGRAPFDETDLELSESFAAQAAIALELAAARADQQRLAVLEDRERIARDLHDHVIQRLFASGLTLEGVAGSSEPATAARLGPVVDDLDLAIQQIRTLIFRLQTSGAARSVRSVVIEAAQEVAPVLGTEPDVTFEGPVDTVADPDLVDDVAAVAREALTNVVRHAGARHVRVSVTAGAGALAVVVADDGRGLGPDARRSGLRNLEERARRHGGGCTLVGLPGGGAELRWSVPL